MVFRKLLKDKLFKKYFISTILYRLLLDFVFIFCISKEYFYWNYHATFTPLSAFCSWLVLLSFVPVTFMATKYKSGVLPSFMFVIFLFSIVPFSSLILFQHFSSLFIIVSLLYFAFLFLLLYFLARKRTDVSKTIDSSKILVVVLLILSFLVFYIWGHYSGFRIYLGLSESEALREDATNYGYSTIMDYAFSWAQLLIPLLLCIYTGKNKAFFSLLCFADILMIYLWIITKNTTVARMGSRGVWRR